MQCSVPTGEMFIVWFAMASSNFAIRVSGLRLAYLHVSGLKLADLQYFELADLQYFAFGGPVEDP